MACDMNNKPTTDMIETADLRDDAAEKGLDEGAIDPTEDKRLVRRIDFHVLPWICITYALSLIDRTNIAAAKIVGMEADHNLTGNQFNVALLVFFITYLVTEIPSNLVIKAVGTQSYLMVLIASWGAIAMCFGFVKTYGQLLALRVLLGFFEGLCHLFDAYATHRNYQRLSFFSPSILASFGFSAALSQVLNTPPYIFGAFVSILTGIMADRVRLCSPFIIGYSILHMAGLAMISWGGSQGARYTGMFLAIAGSNCAIPSAITPNADY
ncbi:hypothetical protein BHE90_005211 [Fusarium euwallaceae]|uniref:Major facilitator superfamily (MFS) profile domain-containing protein n=2 Tax=Fusarium solani species complex TaxID=232080 RepID=A0A430LXB5_9HYPO|nr:hypothetical protein CEP51_012989 [Fusarium floridanum]RTE80281.1 hypothetical protein BHE90_005211 [Fusarium euwallaceae]